MNNFFKNFSKNHPFAYDVVVAGLGFTLALILYYEGWQGFVKPQISKLTAPKATEA